MEITYKKIFDIVFNCDNKKLRQINIEYNYITLEEMFINGVFNKKYHKSIVEELIKIYDSKQHKYFIEEILKKLSRKNYNKI